jgi:chitodextrinase
MYVRNIRRLSILIISILLLTNISVMQQTMANSTLHAVGRIWYTGEGTASSDIESDDGNNEFFNAYVTSFPGSEQPDQVQTQYDNYRFSIRHGLWGAQSFKPSLETLTKVELLVGKGGFPSNDLVVSVRDSLTGSDLTSVFLSADELPYGVHWIEFDFPDISVTIENSYYIVVHTFGGSVCNCYIWGFGRNTSYDDGSLLYSGSSGFSWNNFEMYDFCFITYGIGYGPDNPPNSPTSPSPENNSKNISLNPILSVTVSDPDDGDVLDVYFYNASDECLIGVDYDVSSGNIASVAWHGLHYNTTYSWYTIANDSKSETMSDTWQFTTFSDGVNHPPLKPENPLPENGSVVINTSPKLSVEVIDLDDDTMNVSFYNATNDYLIGIVTDVNSRSKASVDWPDLAYNTTYSWYTIANDSKSETMSDTWQFTTFSPGVNHPPDKPTNPFPENNSENISLNTTVSVTVSDPDNDIMNVTFYDDLDQSLIDINYNVLNGSIALGDWLNLNYNTSYSWYAIANDSKSETKSDTWSFTTADIGYNHPPDMPSNPDPANNSTGVGLFADLWWSSGDLDGDLITYDVYFEANDSTPDILVSLNQFGTHYDPGALENDTLYYWQIVAWDSRGNSTSGPIWHFTTKESQQNNPPNVPTNPSPSNGKTGVSKSPTLSVYVSDPDGDALSVKFYNAGDDSLIGTYGYIQNNSVAEVTWSGLSSGTRYNWYAVVNDTLLENRSDTWSFKTKSSSNINDNSDNTLSSAPIANAGGPYESYVGIGLTFDGSESTDSITSYDWEFGDGSTGTGVSPTHVYTAVGKYTVNLTVIGPGGTDTNVTYATIVEKPNLPPTIPEVGGPQDGTKDTKYYYTALSTDADNDTIQYVFNWGDGKTNTTDFLPNGTATMQTHSWTSAGIYAITVKTSDNKTESGTTEYVVLIDVWLIDDKIKGYLIDNDSDGIYDLFHNGSSGEETDVEQQDDGTYLIDDDGDGTWDYIYDPETDILTEYEEEITEGSDNNMSLFVLGLLLLLVIIVLIIIFWIKKKDKKSEEKTKEKTEDKKEEKLDKTKANPKKPEKTVNKKKSSKKSGKNTKKSGKTGKK